MNTKNITAIVMSAGQGSRMHSALPKSLHPVAGQPILARILRALTSLHLQDIRVVVNPNQQNLVQPVAHAFKAKTFCQSQNKGTASAVQSANIDELKGAVLIVNGDHPLITPEDLEKIIHLFEKESADLCFGSFITENLGDYGRVIRQGGKIKAIVEKRKGATLEAGPTSKVNKKQDISSKTSLKEINTGIYLIKAKVGQAFLPRIKPDNPKKEYGLTDIVSLLVQSGKKVVACPLSADSAFGVNTQKELAFASKKLFTRKLNQLMSEGVVIIDPLNTYVEESVFVGQGSVIYPGAHLRGRTSIGSFCAVENNSFIMDSVIGDFVLIRAGSYLESAEVGAKSAIGPYARLRPGTKVEGECRVGNFAEIKKTHLRARSKVGHFSYLGDADIGEDVNIGAGAVTCNFSQDGKKHSAKIGDKAFIGSGAYMVAPVEIGDEAVVGAGSVITKNVPAKALAIARTPQNNVENYRHRQTKPETEA